MGWKEISADAMKILGKEGKLPKPAIDFNAATAKATKARDDYVAGKKELERTLLVFQNAMSEMKNGYGRFDDAVDGEDFGLDTSKPESKKAIAEATKLIRNWLSANETAIDKYIEELSKLNRVLIDVRRLDAVKV